MNHLLFTSLKRKLFPLQTFQTIQQTISSSSSSSCYKYYSTKPLEISNRHIVIIDRQFSMYQYLHSLSNKDKTNKQQTSSTSLKHPSVGHILSEYSYQHYHRPYNYNDIGEFTLNLIPGEFFTGETASSSVNSSDSSSFQSLNPSVTSFHDLIIWPEQLYIQHLTKQQIPIVYQHLLSTKPLNKQQLIHDLLAVNTTLTSENQGSSMLKVQDFPHTTFLLNVTPQYTLSRAISLVQWVEKNRQNTLKQEKNCFIKYLFTQQEHLLTQFMILPQEQCYQGILTEQQIQQKILPSLVSIQK